MLEDAGCLVRIEEKNLNKKNLLKALEECQNPKIIENQKKNLTDNKAVEIIVDYIIKNAKKDKIQINKKGFNHKFYSNHETNLCVLSSRKIKGNISLAWTSSPEFDYQNPLPESFRRIIPYPIQKELLLHRRFSERFLDGVKISDVTFTQFF